MKRQKVKANFGRWMQTGALQRLPFAARKTLCAETVLSFMLTTGVVFFATSVPDLALADELLQSDRATSSEPKAFLQTFVDYLELSEPLLLCENRRTTSDSSFGSLAVYDSSNFTGGAGFSFVEEPLDDLPSKKKTQRDSVSRLNSKKRLASSKGMHVVAAANGTIVPEVDPNELLASRNRFREFLREDETQVASLDKRFLGTLTSTDQQFNGSELSLLMSFGPNAQVASQTNASLATGGNRDVRLQSDKTYTVQNGKIVEVAVHHDEPGQFEQPMARLDVVADESGNVRPGTVIDLSQEDAGEAATGTSPEATASRDASAPDAGFLPKRSANVFSDFSLSENAPEITSATGQMVRGRVSVPKGFDARNVILRLAGTAVQTYPDQDGFFEIGPFSLGSSFELLVFDVDSRLNRRIVPFFVSDRMREREIKLMASKDLATLVKSFGTDHMATRSGFCGTVAVMPDQWKNLASEKATARLVDSDGRTRELFYYSAQGLPSAERELSADGRVCSFNLEKGFYRLYVNFGNLRRSFFLHLHESTFENSVRFDMSATAYVQSVALSLVDEEVALEMADEKGMKPVSMTRPLQNFWLTNQGKSIWTPAVDYSLVTDSAYAPQQVFSLGARNYFSLGDNLVEVRDADSGTFELIGSDVVQSFGAQGKKLAHHLLSEDLVRDLRNLGENQTSPEDFLLFGDIDTSKFVSGSGAQISKIVITDFWTGSRVMGVTLLGSSNDRNLRFMASGLKTGNYSLSIYGAGNRLLWSSIVRALPSSTQIVSNRTN